MSDHVLHREVLQRVVLLAVAPPLIYCVGLLFLFEGRLAWPGSWLILVGLTGAAMGFATAFILARATASALSQSVELLVRYVLALLLIQFALNKLIPGQFLLYNRDFDLPLRELPAIGSWRGIFSAIRGFTTDLLRASNLWRVFFSVRVGRSGLPRWSRSRRAAVPGSSAAHPFGTPVRVF